MVSSIMGGLYQAGAMKTMSKRLLLLAAAVLFGTAILINLFGGCAKEQESEPDTSTAALPEEQKADSIRDASFSYDIYKTYAEVSAYFGQGTTVIVPQTANALPVRSVGIGAFRSNRTVTHVTLPDSVVNIGASAFADCTALQTVTAKGLRAIGAGAFRDSGLRQIEIPGTLQNLDQYAFSGTALTEITLNGTIAIVGDYCFSNCANLQSVTLSAGIHEISSHMFYNCPSLKTFTVPDSITEIGDYAFAACPDLESVYIPSSVKKIKDGILYGSDNATVRTPSGSTAYNYCTRYSLPTVIQDKP